LWRRGAGRPGRAGRSNGARCRRGARGARRATAIRIGWRAVRIAVFVVRDDVPAPAGNLVEPCSRRRQRFLRNRRRGRRLRTRRHEQRRSSHNEKPLHNNLRGAQSAVHQCDYKRLIAAGVTLDRQARRLVAKHVLCSSAATRHFRQTYRVARKSSTGCIVTCETRVQSEAKWHDRVEKAVAAKDRIDGAPPRRNPTTSHNQASVARSSSSGNRSETVQQPRFAA